MSIELRKSLEIEAILFDWDGTLAQTLEVWLKTFKQAFAALNIYPTDAEIGSRFGNLNIHSELGVTPESEKIFYQHIEVVYDRLKNVPLYDGALSVLQELKDNDLKLGLVSTSNRKMLEAAFKNNKINHLFDVTVTEEDSVKHKPNPEPLFIALDKLGVEPKNALFVGDSIKDTGAAKNAGMDLLLFAPKSHEIYYDLNRLRNEPSVIEVFEVWQNFPFNSVGLYNK